MASVTEGASPIGVYTLEKFASDEAYRRGDAPYETIITKNAYTNAGGQFILDVLAGAITTGLLTNTNANIGVGDGAAAVQATQTDLQGTNKFRKVMDATFPSRAAQVLTFKASFGDTQALFTWNEVALFNAAASGVMLSRITGNYGTKASGSGTWAMTYTITLPG